MSKTEPVEQEEETSSAVPSCSDGSIPSSDKPLAEPRTSTPIQREAPEQATVVTNGSVAFAQPTLINHSQSNGHMANGNGYVSASASDYCDKTEPIAWTVLRWTLIVFLFFVLFIAVCIAAFEVGTESHPLSLRAVFHPIFYGMQCKADLLNSFNFRQRKAPLITAGTSRSRRLTDSTHPSTLRGATRSSTPITVSSTKYSEE